MKKVLKKVLKKSSEKNFEIWTERNLHRQKLGPKKIRTKRNVYIKDKEKAIW